MEIQTEAISFFLSLKGTIRMMKGWSAVKLLFLGTGAADWPFEKTIQVQEFRRLSSAIIDDTLLIDPGPQVLEALQSYHKDPTAVKYIINTHTHEDHYCQKTVDKLMSMGAKFISFSAGEEKALGEYTISSYSGNHSTCPNTVHFMISKENRTLFYGLDGAWLLYDEVQAIKRHKPDLAVFDATIGNCDGDYRVFEHNNLTMVLEMKSSLDEYIGKVCISHMARTLHTSHTILEAEMERYGVIVAYDGLEMDV